MSLFQSNLRKQISKLPKIQNSENLSKLIITIHYYSFVSLSEPIASSSCSPSAVHATPKSDSSPSCKNSTGFELRPPMLSVTAENPPCAGGRVVFGGSGSISFEIQLNLRNRTYVQSSKSGARALEPRFHSVITSHRSLLYTGL